MWMLASLVVAQPIEREYWGTEKSMDPVKLHTCAKSATECSHHIRVLSKVTLFLVVTDGPPVSGKLLSSALFIECLQGAGGGVQTG